MLHTPEVPGLLLARAVLLGSLQAASSSTDGYEPRCPSFEPQSTASAGKCFVHGWELPLKHFSIPICSLGTGFPAQELQGVARKEFCLSCGRHPSSPWMVELCPASFRSKRAQCAMLAITPWHPEPQHPAWWEPHPSNLPAPPAVMLAGGLGLFWGQELQTSQVLGGQRSL